LGSHGALLSFPTRRSSDLETASATTIKDFKSQAASCPAKVKSLTMDDAKAAVVCLKDAAVAAFKSGAIAGIKEAIKQIVDAAAKGEEQLTDEDASLIAKFN